MDVIILYYLTLTAYIDSETYPVFLIRNPSFMYATTLEANINWIQRQLL